MNYVSAGILSVKKAERRCLTDTLITTSERVDELPVVVYWLKQMQVDAIIDRVLGPSHGNWKGLSFGELALVFITYTLMRCSHFLSPVQEWIAENKDSLCEAMGKSVFASDGSDDRLAVLLERLGNDPARPGEQIETELGRHLVRAYNLPTDTARIDMTSVSVHHQSAAEGGLLQFGHSKDHRPDLRQFKEALGTLDPVGIPLVTATLSGEQADDPHYLPVWERMATILGRTDFLVVGDCKLASLENRAIINARGGFYLTPLPMTGTTPTLLQEWVLKPSQPLLPIRLPGQPQDAPDVGVGFEVEVTPTWLNPNTLTPVTWTERHLVIQSQTYAKTLRTSGYRKRRQRCSRLTANQPPTRQIWKSGRRPS